MSSSSSRSVRSVITPSPIATSSTSNKPDAESTAQGAIQRHHNVDGDAIDEQSPLLSPHGEEQAPFITPPADSQHHHQQDDHPHETKSVWYLIALTICLGGLQVAWAVELSNGTPYLLSLGLSKSLMALVWIAGPVTGTLVQPYVGMLSDNCRVSWGRRKPFVLGGAAATSLAYMFLAWIREIVGGFLGLFGADPQSAGVKTTIIIIAVIWIYVLDVAVNTVQASIRAFIVDCAPSHQQEAANSMASRVVGLGNVIGYIAGGINLPRYVWFFGSTQFKDLCAIASIALCSTVLFSTTVIRERNPRLDGRPSEGRLGLLSFFVKIFAAIKRLPPQIAKVCVVQFFAWVGFFPMLFYTSSYIGDIYVQPYLEENPHMTPAELDELYERATRMGTHALLIFAITSLVTNVVLPFFIDPTYDTASKPPGHDHELDADEASTVSKWLQHLVIPGFTLRRAWMFSHILFAVSMFSTLVARSIEAATALIGLIGITWALTLWAPWAIISAEISHRQVMYQAARQQLRHITHAANDTPSSPLVNNGRQSSENEREPDQAGVILGIHNMAIASPQMIATLGSSIIFRFFQKPRGVPGDHSYSIVLASGGVFVLFAAYLVHKIEDNASPLPENAAIYATEEGEPIPSRKHSVETSRASLEQATIARSSSFGGGLEY
ncbi:major facilitator superfamily domain-containing protein [Xylaria bambusicola]|uniref:major facilitator superfamily domain-containing protein n=1 Tax=Xylaria bambusicola TaxID=326684 RepID=UPI0020084376|nr:major facilitator superfamily domain-containing protein [Xylaria bambusicola]KAI0526491.1 major facilitator superfamily domain-containing protein [Xylaria bambusicola]